MTKKSDRYKVLEVNPTKRLPVCFLIDKSFSMRAVTGGKRTGRKYVKDGQEWEEVEDAGPMRIDILLNGVRQYVRDIQSNNKAYSSVELSIISFGDNVEIVRQFSQVDSSENISIVAGDDNTFLGKAVRSACQLLAMRKEDYKSRSVGYFQPQLVIFTDGCATDTNVCQEVAKEVQTLMQNTDLFCLPFLIGTDEGKSVLSLFGPKHEVFSLHDVNLTDLFQYLSASTISLSTSQAGSSNEIYEKILKDIRNKKKDWRDISAPRG
ncbi:MAG: hypothetical protein JNK90_13400 [Planctomycetaceae bacterium]|nr:hypothetical protein [Planctomycetaceae bacterium]